jgi:hypothetical protein
MRVIKGEDGNFVVEDEPLTVEGEDAARLVAAMKERDEAPPNSERERFLAECDRVYRKVKSAL